MPLQDPTRPIYFPKGRGKCRECGGPRYRGGLCREHLYAKRRTEREAKRVVRERDCATCKAPFKARTGMQKFCSYRCSTANRNARERKANPVASFPCRTCGTRFDQKRHTDKFCSRKCNWDFKMTGSQYKLKLSNERLKAVCEQCSKEFRYKIRSSDRKARFCSSTCFYLSNSGASSPLKREGVFHCPPTKLWNELCALIRSRDGNVCACCSNPPRSRKSLPVDHIVPRRVMHAWGEDPHQIYNLVALCIPCHARKTFVESSILVGDFSGFVAGLQGMNYPMDRVHEAFIQLGLPTQSFRKSQEVA